MHDELGQMKALFADAKRISRERNLATHSPLYDFGDGTNIRRADENEAFECKRSIDRILARSIESCSGSSIAGYGAGLIRQGSNAS